MGIVRRVLWSFLAHMIHPQQLPCASPFFFASIALVGKRWVNGFKNVLRIFGTLDRYFSLAPAGIMWSVVILSPTFMPTTPIDLLGHFIISWGCADVGSPCDFDVFVGVFGEDKHGVVYEEFRWHVNFGVVDACRSWVSELSC